MMPVSLFTVACFAPISYVCVCSPVSFAFKTTAAVNVEPSESDENLLCVSKSYNFPSGKVLLCASQSITSSA